MDLFAVFFLSCISVLFGIILTLCVQYYVIYIYLKKSPQVKCIERPNLFNDYNLPEALKKQIELDDTKNNTSLPVNLVLQFLFHELRHSESLKRWLYKKLSMEFDELLTKTTIGKFFESINIKDMHLGSQFPDIKDIQIDHVKLDKKDEHIESVSLCLNLDYTGNFLLSVEAKMKFGKTAYLSIKVKRVCGNVKLQFSRYPYTHWSFSFYTDPIIDLAVESHFQGRQLQSNITNLIVNQIKKAIKRKHTLPNYKIRYKPFFVKTDPSQLDSDDNEIVPQGQLDVTCAEVSRLSAPEGIINIYCTFSIDSVPYISVYQFEDTVYMVMELTITKLRQAQLGIIFKQDQNNVIVESVSQHSCAYRSGLRTGDIVVLLDNKTVNTVQQVSKLFKSVQTTNITLRIRRQINNYIIRSKNCGDYDDKSVITNDENDDENFVIVENKQENKKKVTKLMASNENMSKLAQTIGSFSLRKRKTSISQSSDGSSTKNTPNSSNPSTPQHSIIKQHSTNKKLSISELPELELTNDNNFNEIFKGKELPLGNILQFKEDFQFNLRENQKYLNINVWGTTNDDEKDILLGYINIPLSHILNECLNSVLGHYIRSYSFLPPTNQQPNQQTHPLLTHSGFEHVFCYGDILISFVWSHDEEIELKRKLSETVLDDIDEKSSLDSGIVLRKHDFIRTQFHRTIQCDFCMKKIWLKDAVQCRQCGLCCHKKCIAKCQLSNGCTMTTNTQQSTTKQDIPDVILQPDESSDDLTDGDIQGNNMKRVNSVNNLAIPGAQYASNSSSRSLPPSPQRTPSRKQSLVVINPFTMCPGVLDDIQKKPLEAAENVNKLLEQIMLCQPDEELMDAAKETGQQFYTNIPHEEKVEKINLMMSELKKTLDSVTMEHMELSKQMGGEESEVEKAKLAFLMGQADAKVHGLSVLMLHYCSSLQHSQEKIV